jgi:hypothetical protein
MENRSEHSPPEQQTWNKKYFTPQAPGRPAQTEVVSQDAVIVPDATANTALCARVREQLQSLLENDGSVRPETAAALYGHVAVCADCARELDAMQRVIHMLEAMPLADLPADYSRLIMRRIQTGQAPPSEISTVQAAGLCDRVREKLQPLLDNDLSVRPEMASALYGHLAVCAECAAEFSTMRRMVNLLETMPSQDLPIDYSAQIMRRIQSGSVVITPAKEQAAPGPTFAASSLVSEGVATHEKRAVTQTLSRSMTGETRLTALQRLLVSVGLSGLFVYLLASGWGRQMLGVNVETARMWLTQVGDHLGRVPVLGALIVSLSAALASVNDAISHTFATLGGMAAQTLAIELSLGIAAVMLVSARRRHSIPGL